MERSKQYIQPRVRTILAFGSLLDNLLLIIPWHMDGAFQSTYMTENGLIVVQRHQTVE